MCLKCIPLQGFTPQFKVETRHKIGMRSAQNVDFRFHHVMDKCNNRKVVFVLQCFTKSRLDNVHISNVSVSAWGLDREAHQSKLAPFKSPNTSDLRVITISNHLLMPLFA